LADTGASAWPWLQLPSPPHPNDVDAFWMHRAVQLASLGWATTAPNPMVGCVIVNEANQKIGEGWHQHYGQPHAEVHALAMAKQTVGTDTLTGCTLYVTLEPCSHHGRTPPCTQALIAAKVSRVVMATLDNNPAVAGKGRDALQAASIPTEVLPTTHPLALACFALNRPFFTRFAKHRPYVAVKLATTLDGATATRSGHSQWITSDPARQWVHLQRANATSILTTAQTLLQDDPLLTVRHPWFSPAHAPLRKTVIVLDAQARLAQHAKNAPRWQSLNVFQPDYLQPVLWVLPAKAQAELDAQFNTLPKHITPVFQPTSFNAQGKACFELPALFKTLSHVHKQQSIWVEAGGTFASQLVAAGCADDVYVLQNQRLLGDATAPKGLQGLPSSLPLSMHDADASLRWVHAQLLTESEAVCHLRPYNDGVRVPQLHSAGRLQFDTDAFLQPLS
ncbi:MAG: bifunctional diaminohydroxyphosphoribosylaminopyrimidine deaminase/5-amino-6-(5-phosphoribosylamino)uracil reductase RibD, partial [Vampirovibrionales bacterium]